MINWLKYKYIYFSISIIFISLSLFGILKWGFKLGVDFTGGVMAEYRFKKGVSTEFVKSEIEKKMNISVSSISQVGGGDTYLLRLANLDDNKKDELKKVLEEATGGDVEELRFENVGPSVGPELVKKTIYAVLISSFSFFWWLLANLAVLNLGFLLSWRCFMTHLS